VLKKAGKRITNMIVREKVSSQSECSVVKHMKLKQLEKSARCDNPVRKTVMLATIDLAEYRQEDVGLKRKGKEVAVYLYTTAFSIMMPISKTLRYGTSYRWIKITHIVLSFLLLLVSWPDCKT